MVPQPKLIRRRPPGWRFDFGAADEAARQLELTAQSLLQAAAVLEQDAEMVTDDWRGRFREVFDVESARYDVAARALADDMLRTAAAIRAGAVEASTAWVTVEE